MKINVGCGPLPIPGWLNFDNSLSVRIAKIPVVQVFLSESHRRVVQAARRGNVLWANATHLPIKSGTVDAIYSCHMLEHLDQYEARKFLSEAKRALKSGGILRVCVPNLGYHASAYLKDGDADEFIMRIRMAYVRPRSFLAWLRHAFIGPRHHLWMYDGRSLSKLFVSAGFRNVEILSAGVTRIENPGELNLREREEESIYVEGAR